MYTETRVSGSGHAGALGPTTTTVDSLLALVLDRITDGVLVADDDGVIVYVNRPLLELFGYDAFELLGEPLEILIPEGHCEEHRTHVEQYLVSPEARPMGSDDLDIEGRRADGTHFPLDIKLDVLPGSPLVIATVRDMTIERQASVDCAIARIDLGNASTRIDHLQEALDLIIQRLFALGTSITAGGSNEPVLLDRLAGATRAIDEVIEAVQECRHGSGP